MNDFLAQDKGLTVEQATMMISLFGIGAAVGGAIGGVVGQHMYNIRSRNLSLFMGIVQLSSVPLMWRIIDAEYTSVNLAMNVVIILIAGCIASMAGTNVRFLLINVNAPDTRGFVMSIFDVFNNIGRGLGPLVVTWMVSAMGSRAHGYNFAMTAWWLEALVMALTLFTVEGDEATARGRKNKRGKTKVEI
jgi:predicted MFS family arabinose efflux permease